MTTPTIEEMTPLSKTMRLHCEGSYLNKGKVRGGGVACVTIWNEWMPEVERLEHDLASALEQLEVTRRRLRRLVLNHDPDWPTASEERDRAWADAVAPLPPAPKLTP